MTLTDQTELDALAENANREHDAVLDASASALTHSIAAGEFLLQARNLVPRGEWERWVAENFHAAPTMAKAYMRLARYKHLLPADTTLSQLDALQYLRGLPGIDGKRPQEEINALRDEALRLVAAGFSQREAASILGLAKSTVARWAKGETRNADGAIRKELRTTRKIVRARRHHHRRDLIALGAPKPQPTGTLQEALEHINRASLVLRDQVRRELDPEARGAIVDALAKLALVDDNIRVANRISTRMEKAA